MLTVITGRYVDFSTLARSALVAVAQSRDVSLTDAAITEMLGVLKRLPAHPDALPALVRLRRAGYRLAALTNSPGWIAIEQLRKLVLHLGTVALSAGQDPDAMGDRRAPPSGCRP